jgi:antibiotic biosynthesis monooxygenase (ABM) superfamily enzyme
MLLQIYFDVSPEKAPDFERMYRDVYVPALRKQAGYLSSKLLRLFPPQVAQEIEAAPSEYNFQIELVFDTEENRWRWAASADHQVAWPQAVQLARKVAHRGYDIAGSDR